MDLIRYSEIKWKNPREIVLLRGSGCKRKRCRFCDYHQDFSLDEASNFELNREVLSRVTGKYKSLEVIRMFMEQLYLQFRNHPRADILIENTEFGVGGVCEYAE